MITTADFVECKINDTWPLLIPPDSAARHEHLISNNGGGWERTRLISMCENLGEGDVIYYCGSELGEMPALCSMWGADVVNIEPSHLSWPTIKGIWDANQIRPALLNFQGYASDVTALTPSNPDLALQGGKGFLIAADGWPNSAHEPIPAANGFGDMSQGGANGLPQVRLDDLVREFNIPPPTAVTMDVEGAECKVLWGMEKILRDHHPKLWISWHPEFGFHQFGVYVRELRDFIIHFGYTETWLAYDHEIHMVYL